ILVYHSPDTLLRNIEKTEYLSEEQLEQFTHAWQAYNAALLHFYYRNTDRCLLVHAEQVRLSASKYLQEVRARIGVPLADAKLLTAPTTTLQPGGVSAIDYATQQASTTRSKRQKRSKKAKRLALKQSSIRAAITLPDSEIATDIAPLNTAVLLPDDI